MCFLTSKHNGIFLLSLLLQISHFIALGLESMFFILLHLLRYALEPSI